MVELPTGTARGICDCSHRWSRHDLARTDGGGWALACHDCGRPCVALSKGAAAVYSAPDFGRLLNEHPELDLYPRTHESQNNYQEPGGGRWQFQGPSWTAMTGLHSAPEASAPSVQNAAALKLYAYDLRVWGTGWHAWSTRFVCSLG